MIRLVRRRNGTDETETWPADGVHLGQLDVALSDVRAVRLDARLYAQTPGTLFFRSKDLNWAPPQDYRSWAAWWRMMVGEVAELTDFQDVPVVWLASHEVRVLYKLAHDIAHVTTESVRGEVAERVLARLEPVVFAPLIRIATDGRFRDDWRQLTSLRERGGDALRRLGVGAVYSARASAEDMWEPLCRGYQAWFLKDTSTLAASRRELAQCFSWWIPPVAP